MTRCWGPLQHQRLVQDLAAPKCDKSSPSYGTPATASESLRRNRRAISFAPYFACTVPSLCPARAELSSSLPQDCQGARHHRAAAIERPRRRNNRIEILVAAVLVRSWPRRDQFLSLGPGVSFLGEAEVGRGGRVRCLGRN